MPTESLPHGINGVIGTLAVLSCVMAFMLVAPRSSAKDGDTDVLPPHNPGECYPWQDKDDNGDCQDPPNLQVHHGAHPPEAGQQCWVMEMCLCEEGQSPNGESCAPCSGGEQVTYCR